MIGVSGIQGPTEIVVAAKTAFLGDDVDSENRIQKHGVDILQHVVDEIGAVIAADAKQAVVHTLLQNGNAVVVQMRLDTAENNRDF